MYYVVQERLYKEDEWDDLINAELINGLRGFL